MNEREQIIMRALSERLASLARQLAEEGWHPELIAFAPEEIERIPGFKLALVVPLNSLGWEPQPGESDRLPRSAHPATAAGSLPSRPDDPVAE